MVTKTAIPEARRPAFRVVSDAVVRVVRRLNPWGGATAAPLAEVQVEPITPPIVPAPVSSLISVPAPASVPASTPALAPLQPTGAAPRSPAARSNSPPPRSKRERRDSEAERRIRMDQARAQLTKRIGAEYTGAIFSVLERQLSARPKVLEEIRRGEYLNLVRILRDAVRAFKGSPTAAEIITQLMGPEYVERTPPDGVALPEVRKRRKHPLDGVKRVGWRTRDFHELLQAHGFDTSDSDGQNHFYVQFRGEIIRHPDGRPVVVPSRNGGNISEGVANQILKACADFLVRKEDAERARSGAVHGESPFASV